MKQLVYSIIVSLCLISIICSCSSKEERGGGLLWKISGKYLTEPSYLFGTWHGDTELRNASFLDSVFGFHEAFNSVSQLICETGLYGGRGVEPSQKMYMPKDTTYADILSQSGLKILDSILTKHMNITSEKINLKPEILCNLIIYQHDDYLVNNQLERRRQLFFEKCGVGGVSGEKLEELEKINMDKHVMDTQLLLKAGKKSLTVPTGLDIRIRFDFDNRRQYDPLKNAGLKMDSFLVKFIETPDSLRHARANQIRQTYRSQDIVAFELACKELDVQTKVPEGHRATLGSERNIAWMEHIPQIIKDKPTFIAVGARHLLGEEGLLNLLKNAGYTVEPVLEKN